jgi:uncharacterized protein
MADDRVVLDVLSETDCTALLESHHFGRIAVVVDGAPVIFPVNYVYQQGRIAIRTDPGTKLSGAAQGRVAFEIDAIDEDSRSGWSVLVKGTGYDATDSIDLMSVYVRRFAVDTWVPGSRTRWIRIEPSSVTGRRIRHA